MDWAHVLPPEFRASFDAVALQDLAQPERAVEILAGIK